MQTRKLGNSDLNITRVGFGAWAIGGGGWEFGWGNQEDNDSIAAIKRALELGVNWIDTAAVYGTGHSEEVVAKALAEWHGARPHIFTFLFVAVFYQFLDTGMVKTRRMMVALPLLMVLWTNIHGGFIAGLIIIGAFVGGEFLRAGPHHDDRATGRARHDTDRPAQQR